MMLALLMLVTSAFAWPTYSDVYGPVAECFLEESALLGGQLDPETAYGFPVDDRTRCRVIWDEEIIVSDEFDYNEFVAVAKGVSAVSGRIDWGGGMEPAAGSRINTKFTVEHQQTGSSNLGHTRFEKAGPGDNIFCDKVGGQFPHPTCLTESGSGYSYAWFKTNPLTQEDELHTTMFLNYQGSGWVNDSDGKSWGDLTESAYAPYPGWGPTYPNVRDVHTHPIQHTAAHEMMHTMGFAHVVSNDPMYKPFKSILHETPGEAMGDFSSRYIDWYTKPKAHTRITEDDWGSITYWYGEGGGDKTNFFFSNWFVGGTSNGWIMHDPPYHGTRTGYIPDWESPINHTAKASLGCGDPQAELLPFDERPAPLFITALGARTSAWFDIEVDLIRAPGECAGYGAIPFDSTSILFFGGGTDGSTTKFDPSNMFSQLRSTTTRCSAIYPTEGHNYKVRFRLVETSGLTDEFSAAGSKPNDSEAVWADFINFSCPSEE